MGLLELIAAFTSDDSASALKLLLARQMESMELVMAGMDDAKEGRESVILAERNKRVMEVLRKTLGDERKSRIGIFYGGGHMPDLERRLSKELGLSKAREEWLEAWKIRRPGAAEDGEKPTESGKSGKSGTPVPAEKAKRTEKRAAEGPVRGDPVRRPAAEEDRRFGA